MHAKRTTTPWEEFELEEETWCTRSEQPLPLTPLNMLNKTKVRAGGSLKDRRRCTVSRARKAANGCAPPVNLTSTLELGEEG